ncbi:MAG: hypothetical protein A2919_02490 [Candidatus Spechtbacteria bacterium RIFCSPLOWO2_01_FULL_43_12]|uniref:DUF5667 domain-containing protein n=1 Tax=Candidatus Spechtbacteria bacterium RIFCSPLOWO2_01_FULL_43_12 TaxID=1802162 RepID=A0A1G2HF28_9BACT|nr:MAG: hypothetical protein A2919_02490 [Candidatus Spechtbacteria bacterium RIFCSPLOWO2_01_FULL_43_12]
MREKDVVRQLKRLKDVQPNEEWAVLARQNLLNHIEYEERGNLLSFADLKYWKFALTGTLAVVALVSTGFVLNQPKTIYIQSEYVLSAQDRVNEAKELALSKLEAQEAQRMSEKLDSIALALEKEDSEAKGPEEKEIVEKRANKAKEDILVLTNILSSSESSDEFVKNLRLRIEEDLAKCEDENLAAEVSELLETDDWSNGLFVISGCFVENSEPDVPPSADSPEA